MFNIGKIRANRCVLMTQRNCVDAIPKPESVRNPHTKIDIARESAASFG
jgi:hypothetical protein